MRLSSLYRLALSAVAALAISACGSSNSSSNTGRLNVRLVDGPAVTDYDQILLDVQRVELHSDADGWQVLSSPNTQVDLLKLQNGVSFTLVDGKTISVGHYTQMRLVLGPNNKVVLKDGSTPDLVVPSGMQSGLKINCTFDVAPNTTKDLFIDVDGEHSIFVHTTGGASPRYMLRPVVRAYDKVVTGSILGTLKDAGTGLPIDGATVYAETVDGAGKIAVVTHATTADGGKYVLGLLPVGGSYYVVSQPVITTQPASGPAVTTVYAAKASGAIPVTASAPTPTYDAQFASVTDYGTLSGNITGNVPPGDNALDYASVAQSLDAGGTPVVLVTRQINATYDTTAQKEPYSLPYLPVGAYSAFANRITIDPDTNVATYTNGTAASVNITNGATTTQDVVLP